jgi:alpha-methylacyl-CoA racemase
MAPSPLSGLLVVDLSRHLPGPLAARLLADLGARVIKIEEPRAGDPVRLAPPRHRGTGALAAILLAGVESLALDLKQPAAREVLEALLARADVLLESFRPGTLARLGFPPDHLDKINPRLIVCQLSGWGQTGPYAPKAGHDLTYQAVAGTLSATAPAMPAVPVADLTGAWSAVTAILAALWQRQATGAGTTLDAALFDAAVHSNLVGWAAEAEAPQPLGKPHGLAGHLPCYAIYPSRDGHPIALATLERHFWERLCQATNRPDLARSLYDPTPKAHRKVAQLLKSRTRQEWQELFARLDLPAHPLLAPGEAKIHPQTQARGILETGPEGFPRLGFPVLFDGRRPRGNPQIPQLGEHTPGVLEELGLPGKKGRGVGKAWSLRRWILERLPRRG